MTQLNLFHWSMARFPTKKTFSNSNIPRNNIHFKLGSSFSNS
ncbi:hypothetical protein Anas_12717, partial [Armadillidium nasatum]